jgi:hypothetical protein
MRSNTPQSSSDNGYVDNIIVIYLDGSKFFKPISYCPILPAKLLTLHIYFHGSASILYKLLYRPLFFSIVLDSKLFGSNKGYHLCSPLPSFPQCVLLFCDGSLSEGISQFFIKDPFQKVQFYKCKQMCLADFPSELCI